MTGGVDHATDELMFVAQSLLNQSNTGQLVLELDGQQIVANINNTVTRNQPVCPEGHMQTNHGLKCGVFNTIHWDMYCTNFRSVN